MAHTLNAQTKTDITYVVNYITKSGNGLEKPYLDDKSTELLSKHYAQYGYTSQIQFLEDLKNKPLVTLLNLVLYLS